MHIDFILQWWMIPTLITIIGIAYAVFQEDDWKGILLMIPVLFVSLISWIIAGILK